MNREFNLGHPSGVPPEKICGCEAHFSAVQEVLAMEGKPNNLHPLENGKNVSYDVVGYSVVLEGLVLATAFIILEDTT